MFGLVEITHGPDKGRTFTLATGQTLLLGRAPSPGVGLRDPQVSRVHCRLQMEPGRVLLDDSGSAGGTWVNGERVSRCELQPGDLIRIGDTQLSFRWTDVDEQRTEPYQPSDES
jgi:eukaryotic-like serine/threonine-protein kinase